MKTVDRAKARPEIGHSTERLYEDRHMKQKRKTQAGQMVCQRCGAVSMQKHWFVNSELAAQIKDNPLSRLVVCPGCQRVEDQHFEGEVVLKSPLLSEQREMFWGTLYHAAAKGYLHNPLSQIAAIHEKDDTIRIITTTCTLSERLGKAINKAFKGKLKITPSEDEKFVFVKWQRP